MESAIHLRRLAAYIRVSDLGERDPDSVTTQTEDDQREGCATIARLSSARVVHEVIARNTSGGKRWPEPKLADLIERVDAGEFDGIVVFDLARFGRHLAALEVIERWAEEGKVFLSAKDKFDATEPSGRMCLRMMMVVARYYWEEIRDRFMKAQAKAFKRGAHIGRTPLGYVRVTDEASPRAGCLDIDPVFGPVVTEAYKRAAADGLGAAVAWLEANAPQRRWTTDDARRLLKQRVYLGEVSLRDERKRAHAALTTLDTYTAAQTEPGPRASSVGYPLSKVATCEACGAGLTGQLQRVRGVSYRRYRCSNTECGGGSSIGADVLEAHVRAVLAPELEAGRYRVRFEVAGLQEARNALTEASEELNAFIVNTSARHAAYGAGLAARSRAVELAQAHYDDLVLTANRSANLPAASQLGEDAQLLRAIRSVIASITVARGKRGGHYSTRVGAAERIVITDIDGDVLDLDDGAGVLAA